jgi:uncharacterized protein (DUF1800 family)
MALTSAQVRAAHVALNRFGLGARPQAIARIGANAKAAVLREVSSQTIQHLSTTTGLLPMATLAGLVDGDFDPQDQAYRTELRLRIMKHRQVEVGFVERLVLFFSNHFSITINKDGAPRPMLGQMERDVIRRHVLGSFKDMLIGVVQHPAMLDYLDASSSVGPNSPLGREHGVGLNENLAREILELHTLGVNGGYTQSDVIQLARVLTGWSVVRGWEAEYGFDGGNASNRGQFIYRASRHEPGTHTVLRQRFPDTGIEQGKAVLTMLAEHPKTAEFIAFKLVHHFITDAPTPAMVQPVAHAFLSTRGNLRAVATALVNLPEAWSRPLRKLRTPYELELAKMRAIGKPYRTNDGWLFTETLKSLRHLPWERKTPDGYPDETDYWLSPDAMRIRLETAHMSARAFRWSGPYPLAPAALARALFSTQLSAASLAAIRSAPDEETAMATVFMLPEFQWR